MAMVIKIYCKRPFLHNIYSLILLYVSLGCYSSLEDQICKKNNTGDNTDMLFWHRKCTDISSICRENSTDLMGVNASFCFDHKSLEYVPVHRVIQRVLASEEYY